MPTRVDKHVIGLDILRLAAACLVVCYHFGFWNWVRGQPLANLPAGTIAARGAWLHFGWIGVEIFFVISGFVIAFTASETHPTAFLRSRFLRLAPVNWIAATLVLPIWWGLGDHPAPALALAYVETMLFWPLNALDGVWWTLGIEIDFYLLVYILLRTGRAGMLEPIMVLVGLASGLFWTVALLAETVLDGRSGVFEVLHMLVVKAEGNRELQLLLVQHGCLFALGTVIWHGTTGGMTTRRAVALTVLVLCCLLEIVGQNRIISRAALMDLSALPASAAWMCAMAVLTVSVAFNTALVRFAGRTVAMIRFAGLATYPLYLLHNATGIGAITVLTPRFGPIALVLATACVFAVAALVAGVLEPALRRLVSACWPKDLAMNAIPYPKPAE